MFANVAECREMSVFQRDEAGFSSFIRADRLPAR